VKVGAKQCHELVEIDGAAIAPAVEVCALEGKPPAKGGIAAPIQPNSLGLGLCPVFSLASLELSHKGVELRQRQRAVHVDVMPREEAHQRVQLRVVH